MRSPAFDVHGDALAVLVAGAGADGDDFAFLRLFLGGVGDDDPALGLGFFFDASDERRGRPEDERPCSEFSDGAGSRCAAKLALGPSECQRIPLEVARRARNTRLGQALSEKIGGRTSRGGRLQAGDRRSGEPGGRNRVLS